jgi:hypothetical protein
MFVSIYICLPAWRQLRPLNRKGIAAKLNAFKVAQTLRLWGSGIHRCACDRNGNMGLTLAMRRLHPCPTERRGVLRSSGPQLEKR